MEQPLQQQLLELALRSIRHGLEHGSPLQPNHNDYPAELAEPGACFVTLQRNSELRGCIGSLQAHRPLIDDVAHNAFAAAFEDPRFPPLSVTELAGLELHISLLTRPEPLPFRDQADLLGKLRPGIDGLILTEGYRRGTFLPSVWEQLPTAEQFLTHLKLKAGLPADYWSDTIEVERYETEIFGMEVSEP